MVLVLLTVRPFDAAVTVVMRVYIPMVVANAVGMYVFCVMVRNFRHEHALQEEHDAHAREKDQ